ncbi:MAG: zinc ribbon domain-containing protein [Saccharofermentans sp.]|nr:zinc ribbon domain-containing protein [Saccharofermentans sp.]
MNCSKCNAPIEDGAVFCSECGTPVAAPAAAPVAAPEAAPVNPAPVAPEAEAPAQADPNQQNFQQKTAQFAQNAAQGAKNFAKNAKTAVANNELATGTFDIFKLSLQKPSAAAKTVVASANLLPGMLLVAVQCVVIILLYMIKVPGVSNDYVDFGNRLGYAFILAIGFAALYAVEAAGIVLKKDPTKNVTFQSAFSAIGTQTVYPTCILVLTFIFGLFTSDISSMLSQLTTIVYATVSSRVIYDNVEGDDDTKNITTVIIAAVAFLCMFLLRIAASKVLYAR